MDCIWVVPIPFDLLFGIPYYASIPEEAFTCDYLGAKIVYSNEPVKLIPDTVPLPQEQGVQITQQNSGPDMAAVLATAAIQGVASSVSIPAAPPPIKQPVYTPRPQVQTSAPKPTYTPKPIPTYQRVPRASSFGRSGNLPSTDWNTRQNTGLQQVR